MVITTNSDKLTRTAREMTEAQRDSYKALTENLAAAHRRGVGLTHEGMEFLKLQQRNVRFAQNWLREGTEALREQTEHNLRTTEAFARSARKQQKGMRALAQGWRDAYEGFFFSPFAYAQEGLKTLQQATEQGVNVAQQLVEQGAEATEQAARQGLRVTEEVTERTEEVLRQTEEATREAELGASVLGALGTEDYEGLTVAEVTEKLNDLSVEELKRLRELEKRTKDRESLVERIDRKLRANS